MQENVYVYFPFIQLQKVKEGMKYTYNATCVQHSNNQKPSSEDQVWRRERNETGRQADKKRAGGRAFNSRKK